MSPKFKPATNYLRVRLLAGRLDDMDTDNVCRAEVVDAGAYWNKELAGRQVLFAASADARRADPEQGHYWLHAKDVITFEETPQ